MNKLNTRLVTALSLAVLGAGLYLGWRYSQSLPLAQPAPPAAAVAPPPLAVASAPEKPPIEYPVTALAEPDTQPLPSLSNAAEANAFFNNVLSDLIGRSRVLNFIQFDDFARRVVGTVDNLTRSHAPPSLWPVNPTPGQFTVLAAGGSTGTVINPENSLRYTPLVQLAEAIDPGKAVALYARLYPLFQRAYEDIGFPGRYFNDRLVTVIDHLLATPVQSRPLQVTLVEVKGSVPSLRPWVRYEYVDPALQRLSSGQKILLRVGPENHRRLRALLQTYRGVLTGAPLTAAAASASASAALSPASGTSLLTKPIAKSAAKAARAASAKR